MMKNIAKVARSKSRELRPRRSFSGFGSKRVGVRKNSVNTYDV